jgi:pyruvate formate lyase activating enzyme
MHIYHREKCIVCGKCIDTCYSNTLELTGKQMSIEQVVDEVLKDRPFYETSGGGITISGGEPLLQRDFARGILEKCKAEGLHTAIETIADCRWEDLLSLLPLIDLMMVDLKHLDPEKHKKVTGASNKTILENSRKLAETDKPIIFRIPIIPTVNDTPEEVMAIARFVNELIDIRKNNTPEDINIRIEMLPFHKLASDKYRSLGLLYSASELETPPKQKMEELKQVVKSYDIPLCGK